MSKLIGIKLNEKFGILEAQECKFETTPDHLVVIKAHVGAGKSSLGKAVSIGLSGGSERGLPVDMKAYKDADIDDEIAYGDVPIFMHTSYTGGKLSSYLYTKDKDGKKCKNPVINGKKMTAAVMRDELKTELTFGIQDFISDDPRRQMEWMMATYQEKLKEKGVVFDKRSPNYQGSILYQLEQAKLDRSQKYEHMRTLNAFKVSLDADGLKESEIPEYISIDDINKKRDAANEKYFEKTQKINDELNGIKIRSSKAISVLDSYNSSLEEKKKNEDEKNRLSVDAYNRNLKEKKDKRLEIRSHIDFLTSKGAPTDGVIKWFDSLPEIGDEKKYEEYVVHPIPNKDGKYINDNYSYPDNVKSAFAELDECRKEYISKSSEKIDKPNLDEYQREIEAAKRSNNIADRWAAFFDHQKADKEVKRLFSEYRKIFTSIDLGVKGLRIDIVGDENDMNMRTMYNGEHNPQLFGNMNGEYRPVSSYSETQKNVLAILMQIHLLDEKKKKGDNALRFLFIESPMDTPTRDMLIEYQKKYDLQILTTMTCDVEADKLKDGEIAIENGYLISKGGGK